MKTEAALVLPFLALLSSSTALGAQLPTRVLPASGLAHDANTSSAYPFHYGRCRMQQVIDGSAFCQANALLFGFAFRRETGGSLGGYDLPAVALGNVTVQIGATSASAATLSSTFASNLTHQMTTVVSGNYNLPAQNQVRSPKPGPFNIALTLSQPWIYYRKDGNLLLDFQMAAAKQVYNGYWIDGYRRNSYGDYYAKGITGALQNNERPLLSFAGPFDAVPGGSFTLQLAWTTKSYPATLFMGLSHEQWGALKLPLDLAALGAPGNHLYTGPDLMMPLVFQLQGNQRYLAKATLPIPNDERLAGWHVFFQGYMLDPQANALGMVFTNYAEAVLGGGPVQMQSVAASDAQATSGFVSPNSPSGAVLQLSGAFN